jgi:hypothetical protein
MSAQTASRSWGFARSARAAHHIHTLWRRRIDRSPAALNRWRRLGPTPGSTFVHFALTDPSLILRRCGVARMSKVAGTGLSLGGKETPAWSKVVVLTALRWAIVGMLGGFATLGVVQHERAPQPMPVTTTVTSLTETKAQETKTRSPSFSREIVLLAQCRKELAEGNSVRAMEILDRYDREFPFGKLVAEALLLRVEILRTRGERARALALAHQFVARNPKSPYAASMRKLIGEARPR